MTGHSKQCYPVYRNVYTLKHFNSFVKINTRPYYVTLPFWDDLSRTVGLIATQWRIQGVSRVSRHPPFCLGAVFKKNIF